MKKMLITFFVLFLFNLSFISQAQAIAPCAVCVVAIGSGLGVSRALGIDDTMTGVWVGALLLAVAMFTLNWLKNKWPKFKWSSIISVAGTYLLTLPFFFTLKLFAKSGQVHGLNKLALGMVMGTIFLALGLYTERLLRNFKTEGKAFFPFQKVIVPLVFLFLATLMMWITCVS